MVSLRKIARALAMVAASAASADAFGAVAPAVPASEAAREGRPPFERLSGVALTSVATGRPALLTDQWRSDAPFPWQAGERCVVEMLRHFGWVFCWERAVQLRRDALPALEERGVKLLVVGIGTLESGREFCARTGLPASMLLVDETEETRAYLSAGTRNSQRDPSKNNKQIFEGIGSMWSKATTDAIEERGRDDLNAITGSIFNPGIYKPLMPASIEATLVQGASFVFDGKEALLEHYDESSGAHVTIEELLEAALSK